MAKVFTITVPPDLGRKKRERTTDPRYVDGQRLLVPVVTSSEKSEIVVIQNWEAALRNSPKR